jgi:hypothetical protein
MEGTKYATMTICGFIIQIYDSCRRVSSMLGGDLDRKQICFERRCLLLVGGSENCKIVAPHCENRDSPVLDGKRLTSPSIRSRTSSMTASGSAANSLRGAPVAKQSASSHEEETIGRDNGSVESCCPCQELGNDCAEKSSLGELGAIVIVPRSRRYSKEFL